MKRKQQQTPEKITKVFLKVFYLLGKKIRSLTQKSMVKIMNFVQQNDMKTYEVPVKKGLNRLVEWYESIEIKYVYNHPLNSLGLMKQAFRELKVFRLYESVENKQKISHMVMYLQKMCSTILLSRFEQKIVSYETTLSKVQIFCGTLVLLINPIKRYFLLRFKSQYASFMRSNYSSIINIQNTGNQINKQRSKQIQDFNKMIIDQNSEDIKYNYQIQQLTPQQQIVQNQNIFTQVQNEFREKNEFENHEYKQNLIQEYGGRQYRQQDIDLKDEYHQGKAQNFEEKKGLSSISLSSENSKKSLNFSKDTKRKAFIHGNIAGQNKAKSKNKMKFKSVPSGTTPKKTNLNKQTDQSLVQTPKQIQKSKRQQKDEIQLKNQTQNDINLPIINSINDFKCKKEDKKEDVINLQSSKVSQQSKSPKVSLSNSTVSMNQQFYSYQSNLGVKKPTSPKKVCFKKSQKSLHNREFFPNKTPVVTNLQESPLEYDIKRFSDQGYSETEEKNVHKHKTPAFGKQDQFVIGTPDFSHFYSFPNVSVQHLRRETSRIYQKSKSSLLGSRVSNCSNITNNQNGEPVVFKNMNSNGSSMLESKVTMNKNQEHGVRQLVQNLSNTNHTKTIRPTTNKMPTTQEKTSQSIKNIDLSIVSNVNNKNKSHKKQQEGYINFNKNNGSTSNLNKVQVKRQQVDNNKGNQSMNPRLKNNSKNINFSNEFRNEYKFPINYMKKTEQVGMLEMNIGLKDNIEKKRQHANFIQEYQSNGEYFDQSSKMISQRNMKNGYNMQKEIVGVNKSPSGHVLVKKQSQGSGIQLQFKQKRPTGVVNMKSTRQKITTKLEAGQKTKSSKSIKNQPQNPNKNSGLSAVSSGTKLPSSTSSGIKVTSKQIAKSPGVMKKSKKTTLTNDLTKNQKTASLIHQQSLQSSRHSGSGNLSLYTTTITTMATTIPINLPMNYPSMPKFIPQQPYNNYKAHRSPTNSYAPPNSQISKNPSDKKISFHTSNNKIMVHSNKSPNHGKQEINFKSVNLNNQNRVKKQDKNKN